MFRRSEALIAIVARAAVASACVTGPLSAAATAQEPTPAAAPADQPAADVQRWIADLDHDRFAVREAAQHRLLNAGQAALAPVGDAALHGSLESSTRAVSMLLQWVQSPDDALSLGALERLAQLTNRPTEAAMAADRLAKKREDAAMATVIELGGRIEFATRVPVFSSLPGLQVVVGPKWTGGKEGLSHISSIRRATMVSLYSAAIPGDEAAAELASISHLQCVEFYGTEVSEKALEQLRTALPHATIDVRGPARLGIAGEPFSSGGARVTEVQSGTAAEKAGLRPGDIITEIQGVEVADFVALTTEIAKAKPGESVKLKVMRPSEVGVPTPTPIDIVVQFARWGDEDRVNPSAPSPLDGLPGSTPMRVFIDR